MMLYIFPLVVLALSYFYAKSTSQQNKKLLWIVACFMMWFLLALRGAKVGSDTPVYIKYLHIANGLKWQEIAPYFKKDYGFYYFSKAISTITLSEQFFLAITAFLSCIGVWSFLKDNSKNPVLSLFYYITLANYLFLFSGIRQSISISICLLSVRFAKDRKPFKYLLLIALGATFHHSALLFLPTYIIVNRKFSFKLLVIEIVVTIVIMLSYRMLQTRIGDLLEYEYYEVESVSNGIPFYLILLIILFLALLGHRQLSARDTDNIAINMALVAFAFWTFRLFDRVAERPSYYWLVAFPVLLTNENYYYNERSQKTIILLSIFVSYLLFFRRASGISYSFFWT